MPYRLNFFHTYHLKSILQSLKLNKRFDDIIINTPNDLSLALINQYSIVTVSGESFGSHENIRLSYAASDEILDDALNKIKLFVNHLI